MSTENLNDQKAVEKLKELIDKIDIGMLCSDEGHGVHVHAVPMSRQEVEDDGTIWLLFSAESTSHANISQNRNVSLLYSDPGSYSFLSIHATADIVRDQARIDKYWNKMMDAWFEKGKDDPAIRLLKVTPVAAHYWDNKTNKLVTMFKVLTSAVTSQPMDIGRQGNLDI